MYIKYYCPLCNTQHMEEIEENENTLFLLQGAHELDCPEGNGEICENVYRVDKSVFDEYQSLVEEQKIISKKILEL